MTGSRAVVLSLVASSLASLGLVALYVIGGNPQAEGILLGLALGGLGAAFVIWSITLLDAPVEVEERHPLRSDGAKPSTAEAREAGDVTRRTFLTRLLLGAGGLLAAALAIPEGLIHGMMRLQELIKQRRGQWRTYVDRGPQRQSWEGDVR